jgi:transcriptional regulator with XRE-family HTH domain
LGAKRSTSQKHVALLAAPRGQMKNSKPRSEVDEYIGSRIRERRLSLRVTQEQLARALGVSFQQVQNYEKGTNGISAVRLFDICNVLNVSLATMFPPACPKGLSRPVSGTRSARAGQADGEALADARRSA